MAGGMPASALDGIDIGLLGAAAVLALLAAFELGFRSARRLGHESEKAMTGILATALLALLGLLLAFCFGIVEERFTMRRKLVAEEASAIETTYLRAAILAPGHAERTRGLLRRYTAARLRVRSMETLEASAGPAEALQRELWREAAAVASEDPRSVASGLFIHSLNRVFDLRRERVTVVLYHRLPAAMMFTLAAVAVLAMLAHGYGAGLDRRRALLPTVLLIVSIAAVLLVIVELDRPWEHMFRLNQHALRSVYDAMSR